MKSKIALATLMALSLTSLNAAANNVGKVTFNGEIVDSPCVLAPGQDGLDVKVEFGQVSMNKLNADKSENRDFVLKLKDCVMDSKTASINFTSTSVDTAKKVLLARGTATGVGIAIQGVTFGTAAAVPGVMIDGENELKFTAEAKKADSATDVTAGTFTATSDFTITYA